jgi:hypothetical protein
MAHFPGAFPARGNPARAAAPLPSLPNYQRIPIMSLRTAGNVPRRAASLRGFRPARYPVGPGHAAGTPRA